MLYITLRNTIFVRLLFSMPLYVFLSAEFKNPVSFFVSSLLFGILILFVLSDLAVASRLCSTLQYILTAYQGFVQWILNAKATLKMVYKEEGVKINITQFFQIVRVIQKCTVERAFLL